MNLGATVFLLVLLGSSMYAAGRVHARVGFGFGFRSGYRQGYVDGDRAGWNRRRRGNRSTSSARTHESGSANDERAPAAATAADEMLADEMLAEVTAAEVTATDMLLSDVLPADATATALMPLPRGSAPELSGSAPELSGSAPDEQAPARAIGFAHDATIAHGVTTNVAPRQPFRGYGALAWLRAGTTYSSASALGRHAQLD